MNESGSSNNENEESDELKPWRPEDFVNILWHELRTPHIAIKGYQGILSNQELDPLALESLSKSLERIEMVIEGIPEYLHELDKRQASG